MKFEIERTQKTTRNITRRQYGDTPQKKPTSLLKLISTTVAALLVFSGLTLSGCGGGGGSGASQTSVTPPASTGQVANTSYLLVTSDDYGLNKPTFYYSTVNNSFWSIQANLAQDLWDVNAKNILRIDVPKTDKGWPLLNKTFSLEDNSQYEKFPGTFLIFNGLQSTSNKVEKGVITFSPNSVASEYVMGSFDVFMTDYDSGTLPPPQHQIKGIFSFKIGDYGPA